MSKIRERLIGGGIAVAVAGGAFWAITAANATESPEPDPTPEATAEPGHYSTIESQDPIEYVAPEPAVVEAPPADIPVEAPPVVETPTPEQPAPVGEDAPPPGNIDLGGPPAEGPPPPSGENPGN